MGVCINRTRVQSLKLSHHILDLCLLIGGDVPLPVKQQLLLEISKFGHLRKHTHFLSIVGVAKEQDMTLLAVERLLEFTTLSHYLRLDSNIKFCFARKSIYLLVSIYKVVVAVNIAAFLG